MTRAGAARRGAAAAALAAALAAGSPAPAQSAAVLEAIRREGTERSELVPLARALLDSIGPRLTGSPAERRAHAWAAGRYRAWGIEARDEPYGTWVEWRRGTAHVDLLRPRVRTLHAQLLAWSPGTRGAVEGEAVALPPLASPAELEAFLPRARGRWVLASPPPPCRPEDDRERWAAPAPGFGAPRPRAAADSAWEAGLAAAGTSGRWLPMRLEEAGALGVIAASWSGGWGTEKVLGAWTLRAPMLGMGCEDYGLLFRLAGGGAAPVVRVDARAEFGGDVPVSNTLAVLPGSARPDEYVVISAHLDSWDGAAGATDNGSGTVVAMEAMRILRAVLPRPARTIVAAHWSGEEQGLNGSLSFAADHPEVVGGLQALFNLDQGTGRVARIAARGAPDAAERARRWLSRLPPGLAGSVAAGPPPDDEAGSSDYAGFACRGAPAFNLESVEWSYRTYTWHTDRDTFDKLDFDDLRASAVLAAMLAYLASEDPERVPHAPAEGGACRTPSRSMLEFLEKLMQ